MKETPRRRITVSSYLKEISTDQVKNSVVVRGEALLCPPAPLSTAGFFLDIHLKTKWTVFPDICFMVLIWMKVCVFLVLISTARYSGWDLAECGWDLSEWLECLTANANVATVLGSIAASSDTMESEERQMETVLNEVVKKSQKSSVKKRKEKKVTQLSSILDCKNDKHTVYSTVHYPHHKKNEKNVSSLAHLFYQFAYILTVRGGGGGGGWGRRGRFGGGWEGVGGSSIISWGVFFLLRHMQKKHTTNTVKTHSWWMTGQQRFLEKHKISLPNHCSNFAQIWESKGIV
jgi:hypothetical protein